MIADVIDLFDLSHFASGICGGLVVAFIGHVLAKDKDRQLRQESLIAAEKLKIIPMIDYFVEQARSYPSPNWMRLESVRALRDLHFHFRVHLNGRELRSVNNAWNKLEQTNEAEMIGTSKTGAFDPQDPTQAAELAQIRGVLVSRLEGFREAIREV